ncbi:hypothetical protein ELOC111193_15500 [Elizabethkingia occulta]
MADSNPPLFVIKDYCFKIYLVIIFKSSGQFYKKAYKNNSKDWISFFVSHFINHSLKTRYYIKKRICMIQVVPKLHQMYGHLI